jgi:hypothetical protein
MSIGNLKDTGNQGNNMPWQWQVLRGLQCICDELKEININTDGIEQLLQDIIDELAAGIDVTVVNGPGTAAVNIQDGGNSITVDGTVSLSAGTLTALENITVQNPGGASSVNIQDGGNSITVDGGVGVSRTPTILRTSTSSSIAAGAYSMSFASVGTANATVGAGLTILKPGETINFDAGAINNTLGAVVYDSSAVGAELLIITLT